MTERDRFVRFMYRTAELQALERTYDLQRRSVCLSANTADPVISFCIYRVRALRFVTVCPSVHVYIRRYRLPSHVCCCWSCSRPSIKFNHMIGRHHVANLILCSPAAFHYQFLLEYRLSGADSRTKLFCCTAKATATCFYMLKEHLYDCA